MSSKRRNGMFKLREFIAIIIILALSTLTWASVFSIEHNIFAFGYGPLAGESGFPLACDSDINSNIAVFDGLKNAVIIYDKNLSYKGSFLISNKISATPFNLTFKFSPDNYLYIFLSEEILKYDLNGTLLNSFLLREKPVLVGKVIKNFLPLSGERILFKDEFTGEVFIQALGKNEEPKAINIGENNHLIDMDCFGGLIFLLVGTNNLGYQSGYKIVKLSESGEMIKDFNLELQPGSLDIPIKISLSPDGRVFIMFDSFSYSVYDENLQIIKTNKLKDITPMDQISSFIGYTEERLVIPNPTKGVQIFKGEDLKQIIAQVNTSEGKLLLPISVAASDSNIFVYDDLTRKINFYVYENVKRSFLISELIGPISPAQTRIELFATKDGNLFVTSVGLELTIKKYNPQNGDVRDVKIPEYIPPRASIYVRPEDDRIFIYSWFDSILYSFPENVDRVEKVQIKRQESSLYGSNNICRVDSSGNVFILSPVLKRMNVYDKSGDLVLSFNLNREAYYVDFKFFVDSVAFLDQINGKIEIYSKRGEVEETIGQFGAILYPKDKNEYGLERGKFNFPSSLSATANKIYVADSCNSRIQVIERTSNKEGKIVVELQIGSKSAYVNGIRKDLDVPPFIENGRTLVPFRFIGEALGASVNWIAEEKKAIYELNEVKVEIIIGNKTAYVNGKPVTLEVPPKISNGRTFVPLRFVSEALGASVIWEAETKRIIITYPT